MPRASLTGAWSGAYQYPVRHMPETVFEAEIEETAGAFTGTTREPNVLGMTTDAVVTADIDGTRNGSEVSFVKFMNGSGGMRHAVRYEGVANAKLTRIEGKWIIRGEWSGTFFMERADDGAEAAVELEAEAKL